MSVDEILERYSLTRDTARKYIDAIVHQNQSKAADRLCTSTLRPDELGFGDEFPSDVYDVM